jgi:hypothetical protein
MSNPGGAAISAEQLKARYVGTGRFCIRFPRWMGELRTALTTSVIDLLIVQKPCGWCCLTVSLLNTSFSMSGHADMSK